MGCILAVPEENRSQVYERPVPVIPPQDPQKQHQHQHQQPQTQTQHLQPAGICDVIFFPEPGGQMPCRSASQQGGCRRNNCTYAHGPTCLTKFLGYLNSAQSTCDICVFTITCDEISDVIMGLHRRGVKVRVITDDDQADSLGSDIAKLRQAGIPLKFCIVDRRLLMNGSFNWTRQAVLGNQENVVIQENPQLISQFGQQFEKLWGNFTA